MTKERPFRTGGVPEQTAVMIEQILEKVGFVGDRKALSKLTGVPLQRLSAFLQTSRAQIAASKATDLSRTIYYQELKSKVDPELEDDTSLALPSGEAQAMLSDGYHEEKLHGRKPRIYNKTEEENNFSRSKKYIKSQGYDLSDEEIKKWDKLADGK